MRSELQKDEYRGPCVMGSTASHLHNMSSVILIDHVWESSSVCFQSQIRHQLINAEELHLKFVHLSDTDRRKSSLFRKLLFLHLILLEEQLWLKIILRPKSFISSSLSFPFLFSCCSQFEIMDLQSSPFTLSIVHAIVHLTLMDHFASSCLVRSSFPLYLSHCLLFFFHHESLSVCVSLVKWIGSPVTVG